MEPATAQPLSIAATGLRVRLATHTDPGRVRDENEDRLRVYRLADRKYLAPDATFNGALDQAGLLLMVADGMGGMSGGEQASQMCIDVVPEELAKQLKDGPRAAAGREAMRGAIVEAIREANRRILERAKADVKLHGMGCTLTAVVLDGPEAMVAQVGDSRLYMGRGGEVTQVTRDQTVWESLRAQGKDPETALGASQFKSMLMQAVGAQDAVEPEVSDLELRAGDWLVLCTDGLYRVVTPANIHDILRSGSGPAEKARALTALANQNGGPDNVSVIVCQVTGQGGVSRAAA